MYFWIIQHIIVLQVRYISILISICFLLTFIWFRGGNILGGGDEGLTFYSPLISFNLSNTTWVEYSTGVTTITWLPRANLLYFYSILERIGIPSIILQASLIFIIMSVGVISIYSLCLIHLKKGENNKLTSFITALFYLFNPFIISQVWARGLLAYYISFALLPLALLLFALGMKERNFLYALITIFVSFIFSAAFSAFTFIIVFWFVPAIFLLFIILTDKNKLNTAVFGLIFFFLTFFLWAVVNSWWLLPLFLSAGSIYSAGISGSEENLGTLLGVSRNFTPDILIRLLQRTYFFDPSAFSPIYSSIFFQLISWLPVIFLLVGLYKIIRNNLVKFRFFIILFALGLIVSLGANPPLGWLFVEVFKSNPVLQAFRNPFEKFGLVYVLGYAPLFAYGLIFVFEDKKIKILGILSVLILTCGVFAWPMWTGRVIAGPDRKIGVPVPTYYKDLQGWLKDYGGDYRVFMTPIWSGDGAFYDWNGTRFQGFDPMIFFLHQPSISNSFYAPISFEFIPSVRKYIDRVNVAPALQLLRAKYLVDRKDAIMITQTEKDHKKFLTESIFPPLGENISNQRVCDNLYANSLVNNTSWITCQIPPEQSNWVNIRYLHLKIKTDVPSFLDIALGDKNGIRIRWDGRWDSEYSTDSDDWTEVTIPLINPTEYNFAIDFSNVDILVVQARPQEDVRISVGEISLEEVMLDPGKEEKVDAFHLVNTFGSLEVYEPNEFKAPPEFGSLSQVSLMDNFLKFFEQANKEKDSLDRNGFILTSQNKGKNLSDLQKQISLQISDKKKISNTKYWLKTDGEGRGLILLSKTFDPQWKLIPGVTQKELSGNIFDDLNILRRLSLDEENHYVVNGYANFWKVDEDNEYAIVYMPQVIADIGASISKLSISLLLGIIFILIFKKYVKKFS